MMMATWVGRGFSIFDFRFSIGKDIALDGCFEIDFALLIEIRKSKFENHLTIT